MIVSILQNVVIFMPEEVGVFTYRCWMGMIQGQIIVEERVLNSSTGGKPT